MHVPDNNRNGSRSWRLNRATSNPLLVFYDRRAYTDIALLPFYYFAIFARAGNAFISQRWFRSRGYLAETYASLSYRTAGGF